jgi:hypothetical protein
MFQGMFLVPVTLLLFLIRCHLIPVDMRSECRKNVFDLLKSFLDLPLSTRLLPIKT